MGSTRLKSVKKSDNDGQNSRNEQFIVEKNDVRHSTDRPTHFPIR